MTKATSDRSKFVPGRPGKHQRIHPSSEAPDVAQGVGAEVGEASTMAPRIWRVDRDWRTGAGYGPPTRLSSVQLVSWLAWEALRRNVRFQKFCRSIGDSNDHGFSSGQASEDWGLGKYKSFDEDINPDEGVTWPQWIALEPARVVDFVGEREVGRPGPRSPKTLERPDRTARRQITIQGGQVAVVFDLERIKNFKPVLKRQLKQAQLELTRMLDDLESTINPREAVQTPQLGSVIPLLRIADAMFDEPLMSREAIGALVFNESLDPSKEMAKQVKKATDLIYREGYVALLAKG